MPNVEQKIGSIEAHNLEFHQTELKRQTDELNKIISKYSMNFWYVNITMNFMGFLVRLASWHEYINKSLHAILLIDWAGKRLEEVNFIQEHCPMINNEIDKRNFLNRNWLQLKMHLPSKSDDSSYFLHGMVYSWSHLLFRFNLVTFWSIKTHEVVFIYFVQNYRAIENDKNGTIFLFAKLLH